MLPYPYLSADVVRRCLQRNILELVRTLEDGLRRFSLGPQGGIVQPVRNTIALQNQNGMLLSMSAHSIDDGILATKVVTYLPENKPPLPTIQGNVLLFDAHTGSLKCMMDAVEMTAYRTAAASAVATKYLATENPKILAVFGSGTQAKSHIVVLSKMFDFQEIRIWNHREESALSLVGELMTSHEIRTRFVASAAEAARDADVIVTATSSPKPVLQADWLKEGAHVNGACTHICWCGNYEKTCIGVVAAVGAPRLDWQELSSDVMLKSVVYVDSVEGALSESGDIVQSGARIYAEIGEVVLGTKENHRNEMTVFKSLGMAIEDALAAELVYRHAVTEKK
ncbi:ketimine reductase mu-crystallin isoform X1 [Ixodes scapularis]|uniref:ketimine reductase mu-crystallin isoform X1 n=1 Tax=Ixodes scapularis TaxID=6945 RepID=UPI001AD63892|nr:ketimine reductase mu-crystallin isoform X1 [Ixodes scapularis]